MDRDLWKLILILGIVFAFGGWQGLYNIGIGVVFIAGLVIVILITFFKWDLILAVLKAIFKKAGRRR
jgi:uncharacterized membrane protein YdbT with pleckstrin-like domain